MPNRPPAMAVIVYLLTPEDTSAGAGPLTSPAWQMTSSAMGRYLKCIFGIGVGIGLGMGIARLG